MLALAITAAVVAGDHVALRASADRTSAQQAVLWKGDWLEVRGKKRGWLKVYDHRHERPGWISERAVHEVELDAASAPAVRAVIDFVKDTPGQESLGIAYAAIYLKIAPNGAIDAPLWTAFGAMADRLAHRASTGAASGGGSGGGGASDAAVAEQVEVARSWGVAMTSVDQPEGARICYDGSAFHAALALAAGPADAATAVLALTSPDCEPAQVSASERAARDEAKLALLDRAAADPVRVGGPAGNALRIRRAEVAAELAWADARRGDATAASKHADGAVSAFARVEQAELADDDQSAYASAALAVAASRWAAMPSPAAAAETAGWTLKLDPGEAGEVCLSVVPANGAASAPKCTHGQVWASSLRVDRDRSAAVVAVEPLPGWLELWMFRRGGAGNDGGWMVDVLAPTTDGPDRGYVELAGWSPDGSHAVIVREARAAGTGAVHKSYESVALATLTPDATSTTLAGLGAAKRWASAEWRGRTLALR